DFSLDIREGEVVGLAGVDGNGQKELCEVLTGLRKADSGEYKVDGEDFLNKPPVFYIDKSISHIPEDRHTTGLAMNWSLKNNLIFKMLGKAPFAKNGILSKKEIDRNWEKMQKDYQIKANSGEDNARALSGGNQQKIILARELSGDPKVLIANQPTRGLDVGAAEYVRGRILDARNEGTAVLLISADLEEILQLSDRIACIYEGQVMGILPRGADLMEIGALMMGQKQEVKA
ncbi:MAG: ATP-binding cassette domain-containing protein, partial [Blautia sp.]|nr:ATP-binding cassette domain-containing protein [Blautia sp.]